MSLTVTGRQVCIAALKELNAVAQGETPDAPTINDAFTVLQELVDNWTTQRLTCLLQARTVYSLTADQQEYTIGPSALTPDLSTGTAPRPLTIEAAGLLLNSASPAVEIPIAIYTDEAWQAVGLKDQTNPLFTGLLYSPTDPLGTITLWPVPTDGDNDLVLYTALLTPNFTSLTADYVCPPGYAKALRFNLAEALLGLFAVPPPLQEHILRQAAQSLKDIKAVNVSLSDLSLDPAYTPSLGSYNIFTDQGA